MLKAFNLPLPRSTVWQRLRSTTVRLLFFLLTLHWFLPIPSPPRSYTGDAYQPARTPPFQLRNFSGYPPQLYSLRWLLLDMYPVRVMRSPFVHTSFGSTLPPLVHTFFYSPSYYYFWFMVLGYALPATTRVAHTAFFLPACGTLLCGLR